MAVANEPHSVPFPFVETARNPAVAMVVLHSNNWNYDHALSVNGRDAVFTSKSEEDASRCANEADHRPTTHRIQVRSWGGGGDVVYSVETRVDSDQVADGAAEWTTALWHNA